MTNDDIARLGHYYAAHLLDCARLAWEDLPNVTEAEFAEVAFVIELVAVGLRERAGARGAELWKAAQ